MALLPEQDKFEVWKEFMATNTEVFSLGKIDVRAVIDSADIFAQDTKASFNANLPLKGRTELSPTQKADVFALILHKRSKVGI